MLQAAKRRDTLAVSRLIRGVTKGVGTLGRHHEYVKVGSSLESTMTLQRPPRLVQDHFELEDYAHAQGSFLSTYQSKDPPPFDCIYLVACRFMRSISIHMIYCISVSHERWRQRLSLTLLNNPK
jgi:hypothetical protein